MHTLKTLTDVERLMQTCAVRLNDIPMESICYEVKNTISQSHQTVERVTCSTPSIDALKEKVVQHILHIQNQLIELNALYPLEIKAEPVEYPNGVSSITTQSLSIWQTIQSIISLHQYANSIQLPKWLFSLVYSAALSWILAIMMVTSSWVLSISFYSLPSLALVVRLLQSMRT